MKKLTWARLVELSEAGDNTPLLYKQYNNKWHVGGVNTLQANRQEFFLANYPDELGNEGCESDLELEAWELLEASDIEGVVIPTSRLCMPDKL